MARANGGPVLTSMSGTLLASAEGSRRPPRNGPALPLLTRAARVSSRAAAGCRRLQHLSVLIREFFGTHDEEHDRADQGDGHDEQRPEEAGQFIKRAPPEATQGDKVKNQDDDADTRKEEKDARRLLPITMWFHTALFLLPPTSLPLRRKPCARGFIPPMLPSRLVVCRGGSATPPLHNDLDPRNAEEKPYQEPGKPSVENSSDKARVERSGQDRAKNPAHERAETTVPQATAQPLAPLISRLTHDGM